MHVNSKTVENIRLFCSSGKAMVAWVPGPAPLLVQHQRER